MSENLAHGALSEQYTIKDLSPPVFGKPNFTHTDTNINMRDYDNPIVMAYTLSEIGSFVVDIVLGRFWA